MSQSQLIIIIFIAFASFVVVKMNLQTEEKSLNAIDVPELKSPVEAPMIIAPEERAPPMVGGASTVTDVEEFARLVNMLKTNMALMKEGGANVNGIT
jgi:hypothetical protein